MKRLLPAANIIATIAVNYLALGAFVIFQARANEEAKELAARIGGWFLLPCTDNSCWVRAWMYDQTGLSILIILVLVFSLLKNLLRTHMDLTDPTLPTIPFVWGPF